MHIRSYQDDDYLKVTELWFESGVGSLVRNDTLEMIRECLRIGGELFLLVENEEILGSAWITYDGRRLFLHHMAIRPKLQNKGLGKKLMEKVISFAQEKNIQLKLEVNRQNTRAIHLYEKFGFKNLGEFDTFIIREYRKK